MLADLQSRINVDAEFQRGPVWSEAQQALLIDSILRGFDIPKIYLQTLHDGSQHLFDVIDGKQRLTAIWRFVSNNLKLLPETDFQDLGDLSGLCWSKLSSKAKDRLQFTNITVSRIEDATQDEIRELFLRLQNGEPLNAAEKRNAMEGPVRDFVAEKLVKHSLWESTGLREARFGWDEHAAIILALVLEDGPTALKGADLSRLYGKSDFDPEGPSALRTIQLLDTLQNVSMVKPKYLRTRWGIVDLSIVLLRLNKDKTVSPEQVMKFYENFDEERRRVGQTLSDLQTKVVELSLDDGLPSDEIELSQIPSDIFKYHMAFAREGASKENVKTRSDIMYKKFIDFLEDQQGIE